MEHNSNRVLTIKEASKLIEGLSEYRIRNMCISEQLPCFKAGKKYLIDKRQLLKSIIVVLYHVFSTMKEHHL